MFWPIAFASVVYNLNYICLNNLVIAVHRYDDLIICILEFAVNDKLHYTFKSEYTAYWYYWINHQNLISLIRRLSCIYCINWWHILSINLWLVFNGIQVKLLPLLTKSIGDNFVKYGGDIDGVILQCDDLTRYH